MQLLYLKNRGNLLKFYFEAFEIYKEMINFLNENKIKPEEIYKMLNYPGFTRIILIWYR